MGRNKKWDGYTSWSYLEPGIDFEPYPLEKQLNRFPEYDFGLSESQEERVRELMEKNIVIDLHEHLNVFPVEDMLRPRRWVFKAFEGLAHSCSDVVFENGGSKDAQIGPDPIVNFLGMSQADYAHQDLVVPAMKIDDIVRAHRRGKIAVVFCYEHLSPVGNRIDMIDLYFGLGLRSAGLVYNESNLIGTGLSEHMDGGLTNFGYDVVKRMNKTGVIVDVSHCSDLTSMEAIEASDKPVLISHRGSRTLTYNSRMIPDEVSRACAEKGGVIGVEAAGFAPRTKAHPEATIECTLDHLKYLVEILGVDHVGVGPDTFWGDHSQLYKELGEKRTLRRSDLRPLPPKLLPALDPYKMRALAPAEHPYVQGLENPGEVMNIARGLVRDGFSDSEVAKIMGLNALRVIRICWPN